VSAFFERMVSFVSSIARGGTPSELLRSLRSLSGEGDPPDTGLSISRFIIDHPSLDETARRLNAAVRELDQKLERMAEMETGIGPAGVDALKGGDAVAFLSAWSERSTVWQPPGRRKQPPPLRRKPPGAGRHGIFIATGLYNRRLAGGGFGNLPCWTTVTKGNSQQPDTGLSTVPPPPSQGKEVTARGSAVENDSLGRRAFALLPALSGRFRKTPAALPFPESATSRTPPWTVPAGVSLLFQVDEGRAAVGTRKQSSKRWWQEVPTRPGCRQG
jgi:hypothetical protein